MNFASPKFFALLKINILLIVNGLTNLTNAAQERRDGKLGQNTCGEAGHC